MNALAVRVVRLLAQPIYRVGFRLRCAGRDRIPGEGPVILAANHRSVFDPIAVGLLIRRPAYYMAMRELFRTPIHARLLRAIGAFPVDRAGADPQAMDTAHAVLDRGGCLVIFPEGRCCPPGRLGQPRTGVGRLALATGATVVPVAIDVQRSRRFLPPRIRVEAGRPLSFQTADTHVNRAEARRATERIWTEIAARVPA